MNQNHKGFTLIELMIVIAIIGILAVVAYGAYQDYLIRSRVSEGISLAQPALLAVSETFQSNSVIPPNQAATGYVSPGPNATVNVNNITIESGSTGGVVVDLTALAGGGTIRFLPTLIQGSPVSWNCTGGTLAKKYRPSECR